MIWSVLALKCLNGDLLLSCGASYSYLVTNHLLLNFKLH